MVFAFGKSSTAAWFAVLQNMKLGMRIASLST